VSPAPLGVQRDPIYGTYRTPHGEWWIGICNACHQPLLVLNRGDTVYPTPQPEPVSDAIPKAVAHDLFEARMCLGIGAWRAATVMARRSIEGAAAAHNATGSTLKALIQSLAKQQVITPRMQAWAEEVRELGNDAAHAGSPEVTRIDAEEIVDLASAILDDLFVKPALAKAATTRRRAKDEPKDVK